MLLKDRVKQRKKLMLGIIQILALVVLFALTFLAVTYFRAFVEAYQAGIPVRIVSGIALMILMFSLVSARTSTRLRVTITAERENREKRTKLAIVEMFRTKRNWNVKISSALLLFPILVGPLLSSLLGRAQIAYSILCAAAITLLWSDHFILAYRIKRGYYGTNQHEAKELLRFLIKHADKTDFSDGDGLKKIFPTPEEIADHSRVGARLPGYAEA